MLSEQAFYETIVREPSCAALMPATLAAVPAERLLLLEDLGEAADCTRLYSGATTVELHGLLADVVPWLAKLHRVPLTTTDRDRLANRELRALNHAHIFEIPFASQPAWDLDAITPGLETLAAPLRVDRELKRHIASMGARYLADGPCLLHGDFYPGSWLLTTGGVRVIDPEFCFAGCPEFDLGVLLAHVRFMQSAGTVTSLISIDELRSLYQPAESPDARPIQWPLVEQFAAIEILRRLLGVAQLPLPRTLSQKSALIASAVTTLHRAITDEATGERPA
jgi:5-methylthioribose kinase